MRAIVPLACLSLLSACASDTGNYPSLAPRAAEAIDPRVPIENAPAPGMRDPALAAALGDAVAQARGGVGTFNTLAATAERLASQAGARQSESWIAAQQALSVLSAQHGVTTRAAASIDALEAERIDRTRSVTPVDQAAIEAAAAEVARINAPQTATLARLGARLGQ